MTVQLKCFVQSVRFIAVYLDEILYINVLVLIILTFQLSEHTLVPMSSNKRESTVVFNLPHSGLFSNKNLFRTSV